MMPWASGQVQRRLIRKRRPRTILLGCSRYFISGRMKIVMDDGEEMEFGTGDFMECPPGHDAWIVGDEPCVVIDWQGFADYAKRR